MKDPVKDLVVVTGAASGIGEELAVGLSGEWGVVACDLPSRQAELDALAGRHRLSAAVGADVSKPDDVESLFARAAALGPLAGAVSCAGTSARAYLSETTPELFDALVSVNLKGNFLVMRAAFLALREQGRPGSIVVVSSVNAAIGFASQAVYSAAKAAVNSLVSAGAVEGGPHGVRVNAIAPGSTRTRGMNPHAGENPLENRTVPMRRVAQPADMLGPVRFLLSRESAYVTGCVLPVDGGLMHMRGAYLLDLFDNTS